jgi:hypothetical protein
VITDIGDDDALAKVRAGARKCSVWPWVRPVIDEVVYDLGTDLCRSSLSTNILLEQPRSQVQKIVLEAPAVDQVFRSALFALGEARRIGPPLPWHLATARRLVNTLAQCPSTIGTYNQWAAVDYRGTVALAGLRAQLETARPLSDLTLFTSFDETRWGTLRHDALRLYDLLAYDNPKFFALAFTLERLLHDSPGVQIIIRTPSQAAAKAVEEDLKTSAGELLGDGSIVQFVPWGTRLPWCEGRRIEVHAAALPPSRRSMLWSGESTDRILLLYPFEVDYMERSWREGCSSAQNSLAEAVSAFRLGLPPALLPIPTELEVAYKLPADCRRSEPTNGTSVEIGVDADLLFTDLNDELTLSKGGSPTSGVEMAPAVPISLQPDGAIWWVRTGTFVETMTAGKYMRLPVEELHPGYRIIIPRGEGREELFARVVASAHTSTSLQAYEVLFARWRIACCKGHELCGKDWQRLEQRMREEGSSVTWQAYRFWMLGTTIAPEDPEDIRRVGRIANDPLIEQQYQRIAKMATEVRGLHIKLGRILSNAMAEAIEGGGPHLSALADLLGGLDPKELLEEFELRVVRSIGEPTEVPRSQSTGWSRSMSPPTMRGP